MAKRDTTESKKHIEAIRRDKFSITSTASAASAGGGSSPSCVPRRNPLTADLHNAVQNLSAELYAKDVHFLMELIQNAEDNEYPVGVEPSMEFIITSKDITGAGAPSTLLVFNNEDGFSKMNIESLCSIGLSTKKGRRREGFIGEKGIGFKSVFLVSKQPYIFSNGYQIRFNDEPDQECGIGYIVPEWVEDKPTTGDIQSVYGPEKELPTTVIILPLRPEKVTGVKKQLSEVHPELLLFLSKIKRLSVKEIAEGSVKKEETLCSISISSRTNLVSSTDNGSTSWYVELSSKEERDMKCSYYMWRQSFPVKPESRIDGRKGVDKWNISLAFPLGERLNRGAVRAGIYAFLPTNMVTNFSFIIHSDFMLASSRETILLDNAWNLGILSCVGPAFVHVFESFVNTHDLSAISKMFHFVPAHESSFPVLNDVRTDIKDLLMEKYICPCENYCGKEKMKLCKPSQVVRVLQSFRDILMKAKEQGLSQKGIPSLGRFVLHSSLDKEEYGHIMKFLEVAGGENEGQWYKKCIESCELATKLSDDIYVDLLCFIMDYTNIYESSSFETNDIPLRYMKRDSNGNITTDITLSNLVCYTQDTKLDAWLESWSCAFSFHDTPSLFIPNKTHTAIDEHLRGCDIKNWLCSMNCLEYMDMNNFIGLIGCADAGEAVRIAHFLYHTCTNKLVDEIIMADICKSKLLLVDSRGILHVRMKETLIPSNHSKWGNLFNHVNPFIGQNIIDLGEVYAEEKTINGAYAPKDSVLDFLIKFTDAKDIPLFRPPDIELPIVNAQLTCEQAFLLLDWVRHLKSVTFSSMPTKLISSMRNGNWMKTISGFQKPRKCFLANGIKSSLMFQITRSLPGFAVIDENYYGGKIASYGDLLKSFGVTLATEDHFHTLILKHFESLMLTKKMTKILFLPLLKLLKHLTKHKLLDRNEQLATFRGERWLVTSQGTRSPSCSYFVESDKDAISKMTDLAVIDECRYGEGIGIYKNELRLLGVVVDMEEVYKKIPLRLKLPLDASQMSKECMFLLLRCVQKFGESNMPLLDKIKETAWIKTKVGYKHPHECILYEAQWGLLTDFNEIPLIDELFYGESILSFKAELKAIGVAVYIEYAAKKIMDMFRSLISSSSAPTCKEVLMLLSFIKNVRERMPDVSSEFVSSFCEMRFLKTRRGFKFPSESILFDSEWGSICMYVDLPIIDDGFYGIGIYSHRNELELLGVVVDFSEGPHFVVAGLNLPKEPPTFFSSKAALMIIQCASLLMKRSNDNSLPDLFFNKVRESKWLKTCVGYKFPTECVLIQKSWDADLQPLNGPFLDHEFYGPCIFLYKDTLKAIGVKVETYDVCSFVYGHLFSSHDNHVIKKVYEFLRKLKWKPTSDELNSGRIMLWVPQGYGKWVPPNQCALHDKENLFGSNNHPLYFLDKYYNKQMLRYFSFAFDISEYPSMDEYLSLWINWESNDRDERTAHECCLFWEYIIENWDRHDGLIKEKISMVPCTNMPGGTIRLVRKEMSAIADVLELANLFSSANEKEPMFVWYPLEDLPSIPLKKLFEIYECLGVKKLSEMVVSRFPSHISNQGLESQDLKKGLIKPGLLKIILGFLSGPRVRMPLNERRETALSLINIKICESNEPMVIDRVLEFSPEKRYHAKGTMVVLLDKTAQTLVVHRGTYEKKNTSIVMIYFARAISHLFPLHTLSLNNELNHLIQKGITFGFEEKDVKFIMKTENLQIFKEDEKFINSVFSSGIPVTPPLRRSCRGASSTIDSPPGFSHKRLRFEK